jgi:glutamate N-acetyltransferase / amino-acid N-acetyltransferase
LKPKLSPLAPERLPEMPALPGVRMAAVEAGIKYAGRPDLTAIVFDRPAAVAGVFTKSKCPSAPVDWCKAGLPAGRARCVVVNSGNANAFTGMKGKHAAKATAEAAAAVFACSDMEVYLASTGVIGEPLDVSRFEGHLRQLSAKLVEDGWRDAARAIMTTDTYPKMATTEFAARGQKYRLNGIAKGSGMIAPDMATMLAFLATDLPVAPDVLQWCLNRSVGGSFNAITVDSDTSTSDTVLLFSAGRGEAVSSTRDRRLAGFRQALDHVMHDLAMQIVRDGEGATKHVGIEVTGAVSAKSARRIAMSIANSPLVKTAIAGEDANWGRIVMAVGKAGETADRDRLSIYFGDVRVAHKGERDPDYSEREISKIMQRDEIGIRVDIGLGRGSAKVWTCDLTREYVAINGDYRS